MNPVTGRTELHEVTEAWRHYTETADSGDQIATERALARAWNVYQLYAAWDSSKTLETNTTQPHTHEQPQPIRHTTDTQPSIPSQEPSP